MNKLLKIIFVILFIISLLFNICLLNNLNNQSSYIKHLFSYKKAYIKLVEIIGISAEEAEIFVRTIEKKED
tara:strand:- start:411 stop:623 length:213 start_codon:yes stop_codon:yes gene_type:complete